MTNVGQVKWEQAVDQGSKVSYKVLNAEHWQLVSEKIVKEAKENSVEIKKLDSGQVYQVSFVATIAFREKPLESRSIER